MKFSLEWFKGLPSEEKELLAISLQSSGAVLQALHRIIEDHEEVIYNRECDEISYSDTDWACLQAHRNGRKQAFRQIKSLIPKEFI